MIVSDYTALISGRSWRVDPEYDRTVITYAMPDEIPSYILNAGDDADSFYASFVAVTQRAADAARQAVGMWEAVADIEIIEVDSADADMMFGLYNFKRSFEFGTAAYAYYPSFSLSGYGIAGDVFMSTEFPVELDLWLHEIGHALGLEHTHEGDYVLAARLDNATSSVMSYNRQDFRDQLGSLDLEAMVDIYGAPGDANQMVSGHEVRAVPAGDRFGALKDFDGNTFGAEAECQYIGSADVQGDLDTELVMVNAALGRWATLGPDNNDLIEFQNHGAGGDTRVVGVYIDPLVDAGVVVQGSDFDSQQRFENDLKINNLASVLGSDDYDGDGLQEMYFGLADGTAYLHAYMHADGNIQYANYQSEDQMVDFLNAGGFSDWMTWIA
jgi:hypothetical protein